MTDDTRPALADYLTRHYVGLKQRLTRMLGNGDLASDALQDTWLRLQASDEQTPVHSPAGYLLRVATNIAVDVQRRQSRSLSWDEVNELQALADPAPGPAQIAQARGDMRILLDRVDQMPARRRAIFLMVHWEGLSQKETAERLGVSLRTVASELKRCHEAVDAAMSEKTTK